MVSLLVRIRMVLPDQMPMVLRLRAVQVLLAPREVVVLALCSLVLDRDCREDVGIAAALVGALMMRGLLTACLGSVIQIACVVSRRRVLGPLPLRTRVGPRWKLTTGL